MTRRARGFTLMEMLVVLVITALLMSTLFQSLGILRRAQASVDARGLRERQAELADAWYRENVEGLFAADAQAFKGDSHQWRGYSLQPLRGTPGAPTMAWWQLLADARGYRLMYRSGDDPAVAFPIAGENVHFVYVDEAGKAHPEWPPSKGLFPTLPVAVILESGEGADATVLRYVAIAGPLKPHPVPFEPESDQ